MVRLIKTETVISVLMGHFIKKLLFILLFVGVLIAPANAQNEKNMYSYKKIGNKYIVSINNHTEIVKALNAFCKEKGILSGSINGIGAIGELTLRFFNPKTKAYDDKTFREQMEISNLTGNISSMNEQVYLHYAYNRRQERLFRFSRTSTFRNTEWCRGVRGGRL